jgi:hypothetical protein
MKRFFIVGLLFIYNMPFFIFAQEKVILTLEESVNYALEQNPELKTTEKEFKKASAAVMEAYSNVLPKLSRRRELRILENSWV